MDDINNVKENLENINTNFEVDMKMKQLREELSKRFSEYQTTMKYLAADAPLEILCLNAQVEKILLDNGCLRVYDVFNMDLAKIEGIGAVRFRHLTSRLDEFFSML